MEHSVFSDFARCFASEIDKAACKVSNTLRSDTYLKNITPLVSKEGGGYRNWLGEIQKYFTLVGASEQEKCQAALLTTKGPIGSYVHRLVSRNSEISWQEIKTALGEYCEEVVDPHSIFLELANIRQKKNEGIHQYFERIARLAEGAYAGHNLSEPIIGGQVKNFFIKGLRDKEIRLAVLKDDPQNIDVAYQKALSESKWKIRDRSDSDSSYEPMEVCHTRKRFPVETVYSARGRQ